MTVFELNCRNGTLFNKFSIFYTSSQSVRPEISREKTYENVPKNRQKGSCLKFISPKIYWSEDFRSEVCNSGFSALCAQQLYYGRS